MQHATHIPVCRLLYGGVNLGAKVYETGNLAAIRVEGGKLSITGNGPNAQSTDSAEIYARAIEINAGLWAKNARLATRANEIRYADGTITPIKSTENTPAYAPDLAAIGGMYANRIELVGTEKGLGVNLAGQITSTEATSLDVNGNLKTSGNLYTDGSTCIRQPGYAPHAPWQPLQRSCCRKLRQSPYGKKPHGKHPGKHPQSKDDEGAAITASNLKNNATGRIYGNTIHVQASHIQNEKNTDLKGAVIASEADAGKNRLSTGTFSFSDLKNEASMPSNTIVTDIKDTMTGKRPTTMGDTINTMQKKTLM